MDHVRHIPSTQAALGNVPQRGGVSRWHNLSLPLYIIDWCIRVICVTSCLVVVMHFCCIVIIIDNLVIMCNYIIIKVITTSLELHIKEDMAGCLEAVRVRDHQMLDQQASLVRGRCMRLLRVVQCGMAERSNQCTTDQLENVNQAVTELRSKGLSVHLSVCPSC